MAGPRPESPVMANRALDPGLPSRALLFATALTLALVPGGREAGAKTLIYEGEMTSEVRIVVSERYAPDRAGSSLVVKAGRFPSFSYPVNRQAIRDWRRTFDPAPASVEEKKDSRGNLYDEATWKKPPGPVLCRTEFTAALGTDLGGLASNAPWPPAGGGLAEEARAYLGDSEMLDQKQARVRDLAARLTAGARGQHEAVIRIMNWIVDNLQYEVNPESYSASHALDTGRGNCQNYAHLACALLHSQGVAARVVNGLSLNRPWRVPTDSGTITLDGALGRHAWIEVLYPDLGWVSFDPQMSHYFVSTHLVKQAVGMDSPEVSDYYLISGAHAERSERIDPTFGTEVNGFRLARAFPAPTNFIVTGIVRAASGGAAALPAPVGPRPGPAAEPKPLLVTDGKPGSKERIGKTEGPKAPPPPPVESIGISRLAPPVPPGPSRPTPPPSPAPTPAALLAPSPRLPPAPTPGPPIAPSPPAAPTPAAPPPSPGQAGPTAEQLAALTQLAEIGLIDISEDAAEYATSGEEFAQRFEIREPMVLWEAELALYKFGDSEGTLWAEVREDDGGAPSERVRMKSVVRPIPGIRFVPSYQWVGFNFRNLGAGAYLPPGRYWLVLKYTADAIFNWHCRIGNPYLEPDDTRSRRVGMRDWDNIVNVDFNFLLTGVY